VQFEKAVKSSSAKNFLVELELDGTKSMVLVQEVQKHPITRHCLHVD
ncbi:MAG TPA: 50S ribosomal protein L25, partial [Verrucomicrobiales bacterium]|nr:50S ribosomal protein L25 [Verrucomicrobiales bacterium]